MLPMNSCGIMQVSRGGRLEGKGTANVLEGLRGSQGIGPDRRIRQQLRQGLALMVMRHHVAQPAPELLTKTTLTQGQGAISAKRWDVSS
jgi:hypothetical protein